MIVIICLDDNNGMLFNGRRQSRDLHLCQYITQLSSSSALWMNDYSKMLFDGLQGDIRVDPLFLQRAGKGEYCFVENLDITPFLQSVEKVIVFRWNRVYPSDMKFPMHLLDANWTKTEMITFPGKSHEQITQEVYLP